MFGGLKGADMSEPPGAMRRRPKACVAVIGILSWCPTLQAGQDPKVQNATRAAEAWLALLDARDVERAWTELSPEARACSRPLSASVQ